jgi:hypothetical protein
MIPPVVFIVFNRPDCTGRVLERIRAARPARLFVVCDGPRADRPDDAERVAEVRRIVEEGIDWSCAVERDYAETNLGCSRRPSSGIGWALSQVEEAIILEDDCLPDPSFFSFCSELLSRYRNDERVMHIGANNFLPGRWPLRTSYTFSRYNHSWGWATWRRAWRHFDLEAKSWHDPDVQRRVLAGCGSADERGFWHSIFTEAATAPGPLSYWDFQWTLACWSAGGLAVYPKENLVENIGWGADATHTQDDEAWRRRPAAALPSPLVHPMSVSAQPDFDRTAFHSVFMPPTPLGTRLTRALKRMAAQG